MKNYSPMKKLLKGIALFACFYLLYHFLGANNLSNYRVKMEHGLSEYLGKDFSSIISNIAMVLTGIFMVYCFVSGLYRICTFSGYIREFEDKTPGGVVVKGHTSYDNINRILSYRESKLSGMSAENGANLYRECAKIESLYTGYNSGPETQRILSYVESKLSGMSGEKGLNYLANKI
jgi:hypothetical protein